MVFFNRMAVVRVLMVTNGAVLVNGEGHGNVVGSLGEVLGLGVESVLSSTAGANILIVPIDLFKHDDGAVLVLEVLETLGVFVNSRIFLIHNEKSGSVFGHFDLDQVESKALIIREF